MLITISVTDSAIVRVARSVFMRYIWVDEKLVTRYTENFMLKCELGGYGSCKSACASGLQSVCIIYSHVYR